MKILKKLLMLCITISLLSTIFTLNVFAENILAFSDDFSGYAVSGFVSGGGSSATNNVWVMSQVFTGNAYGGSEILDYDGNKVLRLWSGDYGVTGALNLNPEKYTGLGESAEFKVSFRKITPNIDSGIRFMVQENENSYYQIKTEWATGAFHFQKVVDGTVTKDTYIPLVNNVNIWYDVTIKNIANHVFWTVTDTENNITQKGEFIDDEAFSAKGSAAKYQFATTYGGAVEYDNFSLSTIPNTDVDATIKVDEDSFVRKVNYHMLGSGHEWTYQNDIMMKSSTSTEFNEEYLKTAKTIKRYPLARTAGGSLNCFFWKNSIGDYANRENGGYNFWTFNGKLNFGPEEWIKSAYEIDPECSFVVGINVLTESPELNAQYAEFLTGDPSTSPLAKMRADAGIEEPVDVFAYELGNEIDGSLDVYEYIKRIKKTMRAIRAVDPDAKFMACGKSYPMGEHSLYDEGWRYWHKEIVKAVGDEIDYFTYHAYYDGVGIMDQMKYVQVMIDDINSLVGSDRIKVVLTEQAMWDPIDEGSITYALYGCISTADVINRLYNHTGYAGANYYVFPGGDLTGQWAYMGKGVGEDAWYLSGIGKLYNEYFDRLNGSVVKNNITLSSYANYVIEKISALVTANDDELTVILTNKTADRTFPVKFDFKDNYDLVSETLFTADDMNAKILGKDTENAIYTVTSDKNVKDFNSYILEPKTIAFLTLKRTNEKTKNDDETDAEFYARMGLFDEFDDLFASSVSIYNRDVENGDEKRLPALIKEIATLYSKESKNLVEGLSYDDLQLIGKMLISFGKIEYGYDGIERFINLLTLQEQTLRIQKSDSASEIKEILDSGALGIDLCDAGYVSNSQFVCEGLKALEFKNSKDLKKQVKAYSALAHLKQKPAAADVCNLIYEWSEYIDMDLRFWHRIYDKEKTAQDLIDSADGFTSPYDITEFLMDYEENSEKTVFTDDFESYELMEEAFSGAGKVIGNFRSSYQFTAYDGKNEMQIIRDPENADNKVLRLRGLGVGNESCVDIISDISALGQNQRLTADVYRVDNSAYAFGFRMMVNEYELDFYELYFPVSNGVPALRKFVDDKLVFTSDLSGKIAGNTWFNITFEISGNTLSCQIKDASGAVVSSGSVTDPEPFKCNGANSKVQLLTEGHQLEHYVDNIKLETIGDGMPDKAVFADLMYGAEVEIAKNAKTSVDAMTDGDESTPYSSDSSYMLIDLGDEYPIDCIEFNDLILEDSFTVRLAGNNKSPWTNVLQLDKGQNGDVSEFLTDGSKYRYLYLTSKKSYTIGDLKVYTRLDGKTTDWFTNEPIKLLVLRGGLEFSADSLSYDGDKVFTDGNVLMLSEKGNTAFSIGDTSFTVNANSDCVAEESGSVINFTVATALNSGEFIAAFFDAENRFIGSQILSSAALNENFRKAELKASVPENCKYYKLMYWDVTEGQITPITKSYSFTYGG